MKPAKRLLLLTLVVGAIGVFTGNRIGYSSICTRCLEQRRGKEVMIFGQRIHHHQEPMDRNSRVIEYLGWPSIPMGRTETFALILGQPCQHQFKRTGFGRSGIILGGIACGFYAEGPFFKPRLYAMSALDLLYQRIPDLQLTRETYAAIDRLYPVDSPQYRAHLDEGYYEKSRLFLPLNLIEFREQWEEFLKVLHSDVDQPSPPFFEDPTFLETALESPVPVVRQTAANLLTAPLEKTPAKVLALMLENQDPEVVEQVTSHILANKRFDLFGPMLRSQPRALRSSWYRNFDSGDLERLFSQKDPVVDTFAYKVVSTNLQMEMLPQALRRMNEHESPQGRAAIETLLEGPNPLNGGEDAWTRIKILELPMDEVIEIIEVGTAPGQKDPRKWDFLNAVKTLALEGSDEDWEFLQSIYIREVSRGVNETYGAVMAKALMQLDPSRTRAFLVEELMQSDDHHRQSAALAGMGLIADPYFEPVVVQFRDNPPEASSENPYPAESIFKNPHYARYLDYALHRSSGIHHWRLIKDSNQQFIIDTSSRGP